MSTRPENFAPALLIVDFQNDFCPPDGSLAVQNGRSILPIVNDLLSLPGFKKSIATKDWHPQNHISFASNHSAPNNAPFTSFARIVNPLHVLEGGPSKEAESYETRLWPDHCVQNTLGSELVSGLDPQHKITQILEKGMDPRVEMYSAFYDPFTNPRVSDSGLSESLKSSGINWVYIVGLAFDYCVRASAIDARKEGFEVVLIREGTKAVDPSEENIRKVEKELSELGIRVVSIDDQEVQWLK